MAVGMAEAKSREPNVLQRTRGTVPMTDRKMTAIGDVGDDGTQVTQ